MRKIILMLLAVLLIVTAFGAAATVTYAQDGGEDTPSEPVVPIEIDWGIIKLPPPGDFGATTSAYCGSSCG